MTDDDNHGVEFGDPSGQATATYWDAWFRSICAPTGRSFEWYTGPVEVERMLTRHLPTRRSSIGSLAVCDDDAVFENACILHPGSGNSLLPVYLRDKYPSLQQSVIDCSPVAIRDMQQRHDALYAISSTSTSDSSEDTGAVNPSSSSRIDYVVGDVLAEVPSSSAPVLPYPDATFHAWVDKGLLDALFSSCQEAEKESCRRLFVEAHRVLVGPSASSSSSAGQGHCEEGGVCVVVTLAQEHSLRLMLDAVDHGNNNNRCSWSSTVHVHELLPVHEGASALCPFAFVFEKSSGTEDGSTTTTHTLPAVVFYGQRTARHCVYFPADAADGRATFSSLWEAIVEQLEVLRCDFAHHNAQQQTTTDSSTRMVLTFLHVKPSGDFDMTGLEELSTQIMQNTHYQQSVPSLTWTNTGNIVPIGFGIYKLVLECLVDAEELEALCDIIAEEEGEDVVQSVDIDWDKTVPVGDAESIFCKQH